MSLDFALAVQGVITGLTYGLLAVGLVLVYRTSRVLNFAHGEVGTFGAAILGILVVSAHLPYWLGFAAALLAGAGASGLVELVAVRRLRRAPAVMSIVATLGAASFFFVLSLAINSSLSSGSTYPQPAGLPSFHVGLLFMTPAMVAQLVLTPVAVVAIWLFLRTRHGIALRASADNRDTARMMGIPPGRMSLIAWGIAGALSAYGATLTFPSRGFVLTGATLGPGLLVRALLPAILARMESIPVAIGGGVAVGVAEQFLLQNDPAGGGTELAIFIGVFAVLTLQALVARARGRQSDRSGDTDSWLAVQAWAPVPSGLTRIWLVRQLGPVVAGLAGLAFVMCSFGSNRTSLVMTIVVGYILVGLSTYVVTGLSGQLSLGQFAIAGIGAFVSFRLSAEGLGFPAAIAAAALAAAALSVAMGVSALYIRGLLLAVVTLSFAVMADSWLFKQSWVFGGGVDPGRPVVAGVTLATARDYYWFCLPILAVGVWLAWNLSRSGAGRALRAVRDNEDAARALSLHATRLKVQSFAVAGFMAGLGGAVLAHAFALVQPTSFPSGAGITVVAMSAIGGIALLSGPFLGALYLVALPELVQLDSAALAATTLGWLLLVLYFPGGLAQVGRPLRERLVALIVRMSPAAAQAAADSGAGAGLGDGAPRRKAGLELLGRADGAAPPAGVVLSVDAVKRSFGGIRAVDGISVDVAQGETLGIIGANGAGKTTLFEIISGFTRPDAGRVLFQGRDISAVSPERRAELELARSFQDARLFATLTVRETLELAQERLLPTSFLAAVLGVPQASSADRTRRARAGVVLEAMGLTAVADRIISELSTGTRRIAELACVVSLEPQLILLDEPSSGIAQRETEALGELIAGLRSALRATVVIIEHDMPLIMGISDRILAMEAGRMIALGTPAEVRGDPRVVESYLGGDIRAIARSGSRHEIAPAAVRVAASGV